MRWLLAVVVVVGAVAGCGGSSDGDSTEVTSPSTDQQFPDVIDVVADEGTEGWDFDVTVSSPYDTSERYADAWRVVTPDGVVLGVRELGHDHQFEQPFTRSLRAVEVPDDVSAVTVEARDSVNGWGGATVQVELTDR